MKKISMFGLALMVSLGLVSCSNESGTDSAASDKAPESSSTEGTAETGTTATTSTGNYAALSDSFRVNSDAGHYVDPRTGKKLRIKVDPQSGAKVNAETGEPIRRYVDRRSWWVYDATNDQQIGEAREEGGSLKFKGDQNDWVDHDAKWKMDDDEMKLKTKDGTKVKVEKDGDTKIKTADGTKIKSDEDGTKIKKDDR